MNNGFSSPATINVRKGSYYYNIEIIAVKQRSPGGKSIKYTHFFHARIAL